VVFRRDLNELKGSMERRSGLSEVHADGPHTENARYAKLVETAGLNNW